MLAEKTNGAVAVIPTPTREYAERITEQSLLGHVAVAPTAVPTPIPAPPPTLLPRGARVLIWKQDPLVQEIGVRKAFLPSRVFAGPQDARMKIQGLPEVTPNVFGDLIIDPVADPQGFDAVHTFAVVRQALTMYERFQAPAAVPWQWNTGGNTDPLAVYPRAGVTQNAFYSRNQKALKFFYFDSGSPPATVFTCRSFDIVAHEAGHAILDGLKPGWLLFGNPPQTGGLHESFGDLTAIFLALSQLDQVEAIIAQTKANLHAKNFLAEMAEQFGLALGRPNGLRNADNNLKLSEVSTEVHAISQVFTGGVFDVLADIFAFERRPARRDDAATLYDVGQYVASLVYRALKAAPSTAATYADVVNRMLTLVTTDGKPVEYKNFIVNRFAFREVIAPPAVELAAGEDVEIAPGISDEPGAIQDRSGCCGTMQLDEYLSDDESLEAQLAELARAFTAKSAPEEKKKKTRAKAN